MGAQFLKIVGFAGKRFLRSPLPAPSFIFFCSCPSFLDEPRKETLAMQASLTVIIQFLRIVDIYVFQSMQVKVTKVDAKLISLRYTLPMAINLTPSILALT